MLSYLPLAHSFGRILEEFALSVGGHIGYWQVGAGCTIVGRCRHPVLFTVARCRRQALSLPGPAAEQMMLPRCSPRF